MKMKKIIKSVKFNNINEKINLLNNDIDLINKIEKRNLTNEKR